MMLKPEEKADCNMTGVRGCKMIYFLQTWAVQKKFWMSHKGMKLSWEGVKQKKESLREENWKSLVTVGDRGKSFFVGYEQGF